MELVEYEILRKVERIVGYPPTGMLDLLKILVHPDVIELTKKYVERHDDNG